MQSALDLANGLLSGAPAATLVVLAMLAKKMWSMDTRLARVEGNVAAHREATEKEKVQ